MINKEIVIRNNSPFLNNLLKITIYVLAKAFEVYGYKENRNYPFNENFKG